MRLKVRAADIYQTILVVSGVVATALLGVFVYREAYPEYRIYQQDYIELEKFRSTYTGEPPPPFKEEIKQILFADKDNGPEKVDRCISCHVALELTHFSPNMIAKDINGNILLDTQGHPIEQPNPNYIWKKLQEKIDELTDEPKNQQLAETGHKDEVKERLAYAEHLKSLKTAHVGEFVYDVEKVLIMHPLIGRETRPFEYHSIDKFGCTACHGGNGRGLVTDRAHGPVFDEQYEVAYEIAKRPHIESDPANDPLFSKIFNHPPGDRLVFQTTPLLVGPLMQAKCVQCHLPTSHELSEAVSDIQGIVGKKEQYAHILQNSVADEIETLRNLLEISQSIKDKGVQKTLQELQRQTENPHRSNEELSRLKMQLRSLQQFIKSQGTISEEELGQKILRRFNVDIYHMLSSLDDVPALNEALIKGKDNFEDSLKQLFNEKGKTSRGHLFKKMAELHTTQELIDSVKENEDVLHKSFSNTHVAKKIKTEIDFLTDSYQRGEQLYISQACYACHRIAGFARGGVGPELTRAGLNYPWYVKESIVWPQADLHTSTMPNMKLDHEELQDLMTFLMAQRSDSKTTAEAKSQINLKAWEAGKLKSPWEKPLSPEEVMDVRKSMLIFATEGCAACHKLQGFESNVGFNIEKESHPSAEQVEKERLWFSNLIPEDITGSELVTILDKNRIEIDKRIVDGVRKDSILEEIEEIIPDGVAAFYAPFKYASRAKNAYYDKLMEGKKTPQEKTPLLKEKEAWRDLVHRVLMMYMQQYGFGRLIAPKLNWSGVFRSDQWLMEHFFNPSGHSPRSIMPVMPFDPSKFYALTYMLDQLAKVNTKRTRDIWTREGFSPEYAFFIHCSQCHGETLRGNGPVAEWIYPIPKNLRNADFLRNLTKEQAIESITHGVKGTPMPPWGEIAADKQLSIAEPVLTRSEIEQLVHWIYSGLVGGKVIRGSSDVLKWQYSPDDFIEEMKQEGHIPKVSNRKKTVEGPLVAIATDTSSKKQTSEQGQGSKGNGNPIKTEDIFDIYPNPRGGPDAELYYIKKKFYTADNLKAGEAFFMENCSVCHGKDADGSSERAEAMSEGKPRMLINLDWLNTKDDLRLLRSIKFGVPGTSMTPWGDFTNALQRMQLVAYIRSLTEDKGRKEKHSNAIFNVFDKSIETILLARAEFARRLKIDQDAYNKASLLKDELQRKAKNSKDSVEDALDAYQKELVLAKKVRMGREIDQHYADLVEAISKESTLYKNIGEEFLSLEATNSNLGELFIKIVMLNKGRFSYSDKKLAIDPNIPPEKEWEELAADIVEEIQNKINTLSTVKKNAIAERQEQEKHEKEQLQKVKSSLLPTFEEIRRCRLMQKKLVEQLDSLEGAYGQV